MGSLIETIKDDTQRRAVVDDCVVLIDAEVADKKGLSGGVVRTMFKTVKSQNRDQLYVNGRATRRLRCQGSTVLGRVSKFWHP